MATGITLSTPTEIPGAAEHDSIVLCNRMALCSANRPLGDAGASGGTAPAKVRTNATVVFQIDGEFKSKASTDDFWTLTGTTLTAGQVNKWLLYVDGAGAASVVECLVSTTAAGVVVPFPTQAKSCFAYVQVTCNSSTFVPGTTSLAAGTVTTVFWDGMPTDWFKVVGDQGTVISV